MAGNAPAVPAKELGESIAAFRPGMANIFAAIVFAVAGMGGAVFIWCFLIWKVIAAGGNLPADAKVGMSWNAVIFGSIAGLLIFGLGLLMAWIARNMLASGFVIHANGFSRVTRRKVDLVLWSEVTEMVEVAVYERPPLLKGAAILLVPKVKSMEYRIKAGTREFVANQNDVWKIKAFGETLRQEAERRQIAWKKEERNPIL